MKLLYCIKLRDRGKLEATEDTCNQVNQYKNYRLQDRPQEHFGKLAGWLGQWDGARQDHSTDRPRPGRYLKLMKIILFKLNGK